MMMYDVVLFYVVLRNGIYGMVNDGIYGMMNEEEDLIVIDSIDAIKDLSIAALQRQDQLSF